LCSPNDFKKEYTIKGIKVMNGAIAEGLVIPRGSASIIYSADCPTIVYHDIKNDILITAHAGLASLIDRQKIITGFSSRSHESIIDDIMRGRIVTNNRKVFVLCGIGSNSYKYDIDDPVYGERNNKILKYFFDYYGTTVVPTYFEGGGDISLLDVTLQQLDSYGVDTLKEVIHDGVDTYLDPRFHSYYWYSKFGKEEEKLFRNCVLVINNFE
jgi:copper oxidase (laccase) domain-containing protein